MRRSLRRSRAFKAVLTLLYILGAAAAAIGGYSYWILDGKGYYKSTAPQLSHDLMSDLCADDMYMLNEKYKALLAEGYFDEDVTEQLREQLYNGFMDDYSAERTNFFFTISDMSDKPLISSYHDEAQCSRVQVFQTTTSEKLTYDLTEEEYARLDYPDDYLSMSVSDYWTERDLPAEESDLTDEDTLSVLAEGLPVQYDAEGGFVNTTNSDGVPCQIRFDEDGTPTEIRYYDSEYEENAQQGTHIFHVVFTVPHEENSYYISGYVRKDLKAADRYANIHSIVTSRYRLRYVFPIAAGCGLLTMLLSMIALIVCAGYSPAQEKPGATAFEKIPFDLFTVLLGCAGIAPLAAAQMIGLDSAIDSSYTDMAFFTGFGVLWLLLLLWWSVSIAMRIRTGTIVRNNLLIIAFRLIRKLSRKLFRGLRSFAEAVPFIWQILLGMAIYLGVQIISIFVMAAADNGAQMLIGLLLLLAAWGSGCLLTGLIAYNLHLLERGGEQLAAGEFSEKLPERKLFGRFRRHAQHLNSISDGMNKAVNDRIKSEMFRTELIANVSHDIRTPLTSIINYTDLLSRCDLSDPQAQEYVAVLSRQSARLRKLTEDVLEASKATTGNIKVVKQTLDLRVLIEQIEGEFCERLEEKHLTLVKELPAAPQYVSVDGRLMWRVMDNLFGNICKYAMEGTRVYLSVLHEGDEIICTLRNISATQLNISAEALLERFVQGDRSRNTEGSGLGLSIAQSLTTLQDGRLGLAIDGDLFKVTLTFPAASLPEEPAAQ